jgi:hypothetical protein
MRDFEIIVPFEVAATYSRQRVPIVQLRTKVQDWVDTRAFKPRVDFLFGGSYESNHENWKIKFTFDSKADAMIFKLTF